MFKQNFIINYIQRPKVAISKTRQQPFVLLFASFAHERQVNMFNALDIRKVSDAVQEFSHFDDDVLNSWKRIKKSLEGVQNQTNNNARDEICAHCASVGAIKDYYPLAYVYCPYCGRKLSPVA